MILYALTQYYQRKAKSDGGVAPEGFENKEIPFVIVIDKQGKFIQLEDTREVQNKKKIARTFLVPKGLGRSGKKSYEICNLLWDHYGYVLAYAGEKEQEQADNQHATFTAKVNELKTALPDDLGIAAVAAFLANSEEKAKVMQSPNWAECIKIKGCNLTFRLVEEATTLVCQSEALQRYLQQNNQSNQDNTPKGICLVTGRPAPIARLHNAVKGVNAKPAPFTSVNLSAFESYGKEQGFIFPVGEQAMFEYTTALNTLLASDNRFRIGDITTVCWSEKPTPLETKMPFLLNGGGKDNPDAHIGEIKSLYKSLHNGKFIEPNGKDKFYLLGLSPNSARIVVRFWYETTVAKLAENITAWYSDLQMIRGVNSPYPEFMPLPRLLGNLVLDGKIENLPPDLIAQITNAALNNHLLPMSLLQAALRRNKAEQKDRRVTYGRACLIKAYLNRAIRAGNLKNTKELDMSISQMFEEFIDNLAISNKQMISDRYAELTKTLNKQFRGTDSETANTLQVGSFGRKTGINGISDLDMLYIMPKSSWDTYNNAQNGQYKLLSDTKEAILNRYSHTDVSVDRLVVTVTFSNFYIEVQPVFEQEDGSFKYPDTKDGGSWKITKPREEINEISSADEAKNKNLRRLCKMARAWKNKHGVAMGGLLIDTLAYNFLKLTDAYDNKSFSSYDCLSRDFFKYLSELPEQTEYAALGSKQRVKVKKNFQRKAKKAYDLCLKAIDAENQSSVNDKWKKVYGRPFPAKKTEIATESLSKSYSHTWKNTEEFVEDKFTIDIREHLKIDCEVIQDGFRKFLLRYALLHRIPLKSRKNLLFHIVECSVSEPYDIYWKVLNRGEEAKRRDCIRGQIFKDEGYKQRKEKTNFYGDHIVECYCVRNDVVVAKDRIHVPIVTDGSDYD